MAGLSDAGRDYRMHRPCPSRGHLLVCSGGVGRVWVGGEWVTCEEGQAYLSPPRAPTAFETVPGRRWQIAWVYFEGPGAEPTTVFGENRSTLVSADPRPLVNAVEGLYREGTGPADPKLLDHWAELIRAYSLRIIQPKTSEPMDPLWKLWAEVDARPAADWSVERLADLAGMSDEGLRKLCLKHVGRSPMQQVTYLRMRRADTLLQSTPAKLAVIAKMVGYTNVFAFSTAFRRFHDTPPSARRSPAGPPRLAAIAETVDR